MPSKSILITGASSGIGAALAGVYAKSGARLHLLGRNEKRLREVADRCRAAGALVDIAAFDLADIRALLDILEEADRRYPLDLVIFNAGLGGSLPADVVGQDAASSEEMATINFTVPAVGANFIAGRMAARRCGQIVLIGSIAEAFPLPMSPLYSGTKAGLAMFADALGLRLKKHGVRVTLVSPGFIDTPMSRSVDAPKPFLLSAEAAAAIIVGKIERGARRIVVPWQFIIVRAVAAMLPGSLLRAILSRF